jgi:hypothetical protein
MPSRRGRYFTIVKLRDLDVERIPTALVAEIPSW